jgi:hypothetical protein
MFEPSELFKGGRTINREQETARNKENSLCVLWVCKPEQWYYNEKKERKI